MDKNQVMRKLPKVAELLKEPEINLLCETKRHNRVIEAIRESIDTFRQDLMQHLKKCDYTEPDAEYLKKQIVLLIIEKLSSSPYYNLPIAIQTWNTMYKKASGENAMTM